MTIDLEAMRARAEAATEGPWEMVRGNTAPELRLPGFGLLATGAIGTVPYSRGPVDCGDPECDCYEIAVQREADLTFCASARTDISALIAEIERLRRVIGDLREPERVYLVNIGSWGVPSYDAETKRLVEGE